MRTQILKYFWVVTLLFLAGAAVLSAQLASVLLAKRLWIGDVEAAAAVSQRAEPARRDRLADYQAIEKRNVFNAHPKPLKSPPPAERIKQPEPPPPPPPPRVDVNLTGTVVVEGGPSFALVELKSELKLVRERDEVAPGTLLQRVLPDRIVLARGATTEEVLLDSPEKKSRKSPAPPARRGRAARSESPPPDKEDDGGTVRQVAEDKWLIDRGEIEEASENMNKLMTQIRVVPNFTDGQADGFKVFAIRPGSLFAKIGLQNGDVLKRVNGIELQGPEQAFEAYQRLKDESSVQIDLSRRQDNKTFSYEIR